MIPSEHKEAMLCKGSGKCFQCNTEFIHSEERIEVSLIIQSQSDLKSRENLSEVRDLTQHSRLLQL